MLTGIGRTANIPSEAPRENTKKMLLSLFHFTPCPLQARMMAFNLNSQVKNGQSMERVHTTSCRIPQV